MLFTFLTLVTSLALSSATSSAAPHQARQDALKPFEVTGMVYNHPSGRPGRYPWIQVRANVSDPNSYSFTEGSITGTVPAGIQGFNCLAQWYPGEFIEGRTYPCDPAEKGHWVIQVYPGTTGGFSGYDFVIKFIHVVEPGQAIASFRARIEGEAEFKAGTNGTTTYGCFSSGACNAALKQEVVPLLIPVTRTK